MLGVEEEGRWSEGEGDGWDVRWDVRWWVRKVYLRGGERVDWDMGVVEVWEGGWEALVGTLGRGEVK